MPYLVLDDTYKFHSSVYGDPVMGYWPTGNAETNKFVEAVIAGYENGELHDCGHLVTAKNTQKLAFLCAVALDYAPTPEQMQVLQATHGVDFTLYKNEYNPMILGALLTDIQQFPKAYKIVCDCIDLDTLNKPSASPSMAP